MGLTFTLYKKEIKSLFSSWIAYVILIAFTMLSGLSFYLYLQMFTIMTRYSESIEAGVQRQSWNLTDNLIRPLYGTVFILLMIMVPAITMRLFSEEKRQRTEELLLTSPIWLGEIVVAKYLAAITLITVMMVPVVIYPGLVLYYARPLPDWAPMMSGYLGLFLFGYALAAIGLFASSLTENQIVAFVFAIAIEMLFFLVAQATVTFDVIRIGDVVLNIGSVLKAFSINYHYNPMLTGLIRLSDITYFLSLIVFWLWATRQSVESTRWS